MHYTLSSLFTLAVLPHLSRSQPPSNPLEGLSNVTCQPGFDWASNSAQQSPCAIAVATAYACSSTEILPALRPGYHYNTPGDDGQPVNLCTCSWVAYNLFSACTACQGDDESILPYTLYNQNCTSNSGEGSLDATTYYPPNVVPLDDTSIPYYATVNPFQWQSSVFNIIQAKNISSQGFRDITIGTTRSSTTKPKNAMAVIVGSLAGGFSLLLLVAAVTVFRIYRKRGNRDATNSESISPAMRFTMDLPNTSMAIVPYMLPPTVATARMKPSKHSTDRSHNNTLMNRGTMPYTQTGTPQSQSHERGVGPPAYSELFIPARSDVARVARESLTQTSDFKSLDAPYEPTILKF